MSFFPFNENFSFGERIYNEQLINKLLGRKTVHCDLSNAAAIIENKTVLVTGGAGFIGSQLCRTILALGCARLIIYDHWENGLFYIDRKLEPIYKGKYILINGSVTSPEKITEIFSRYNPSLVFHAAANKHVPLVEQNPRQGILTNLLGTIFTARACAVCGCEQFVLISTDKAVNPVSVMGASKRAAEIAVQLINQQSSTVFSCVRFGNVFCSTGSVGEIFMNQIKRREPVTITHPAMTRYFMTVTEAVNLVLKSCETACGGEIFTLDMGSQVSVLELAHKMIESAGLTVNKDIPVIFTGIRSGEKLTEELFEKNEKVISTAHPKILLNAPLPLAENIPELLTTVENEIFSADINRLLYLLSQIVPNFNHHR
ncbi:MAG: polysaccharide biosynthesis protein [Oscillospiraceae bacterium]|nr:polysaccharide biosynthesis protein [Oscillospiraceae bacterium]